MHSYIAEGLWAAHSRARWWLPLRASRAASPVIAYPLCGARFSALSHSRLAVPMRLCLACTSICAQYVVSQQPDSTPMVLFSSLYRSVQG